MNEFTLFSEGSLIQVLDDEYYQRYVDDDEFERIITQNIKGQIFLVERIGIHYYDNIIFCDMISLNTTIRYQSVMVRCDKIRIIA